jgi:PAS domain-containing protein
MLFPVRFTNNWAVALLVALTCAFAVAYLIDSVLVGSTWWARSLRVGSCLAIACVAFRFGFPRQGPGELLARQHMEALCVTDRRDVSANKQQLPAIDTNSPWSNIFSRIRDCLADDRRRADEAEHSWTGAEVRVRRISRELAQVTGILDGLTHPMIATNQFDEVILANQSARELFDFSLDEESPQPLANLVPSSDLVNLLTQTRKRKSPGLRQCELEWTDESGLTSCFRLQCRMMEDSSEYDEDDQGAVAVLTDISDQREIRRRHAEFVSAASHEMKTPLASIRAYPNCCSMARPRGTTKRSNRSWP